MKPSQITGLDRQICGTVWTSPQVTELMELLSYEIGPRPSVLLPLAVVRLHLTS